MKKIKKIFPLLLGIMVLMFGTLTVSAANEDSPYYDNSMNVYDSWQKYVKNSTNYNVSDFRYIYIGTYGDNPKTEYRLFASTKPFTISETGKYMFGDGFVVWGGKNYSASSNMTFFTSNGGTITSAYYVPRFSSFALYNSSGALLSSANDDFFKKPPVALVAQNLPEVVQNQTKVILITAVACLALLVILSVLPKKLPRFLNR